MFSSSTHTRPQRPLTRRGIGGRLRRLVLIVTTVSCGLIVSAVPAFARPIPPIVTGADSVGVPAPASVGSHVARIRTTVRLVTVHGVPAWDVAWIAVGAALLAAAVAVLAYRALAARRSARLATA
jgi:hypothetical protein